ncbi:predicted protein [Ostreococcus lucimarinus CCE9901]|uniref:Uncharacterized protein n=1 Tax=Ostreococcus lucimarinus (strain CCE9901) TaxID=436017 RepID=A4RR50_OSTLU|nr:predicted protein [Ostreococcus lucimarinus CCE9901]ABO93803.1 predicted protein [Ostreococcus lucimarinus CCE9901]|eukprot:XP_001415511.1 predicted protein [Ostreococcus lucimarinus CCE9901]
MKCLISDHFVAKMLDWSSGYDVCLTYTGLRATIWTSTRLRFTSHSYVSQGKRDASRALLA